MKCPICRQGVTHAATVTVALDRPGIGPGEATTIVFRGVPAEVCDNCGEQYVNEEVTAALLQQALAAASSGVDVEVRSFAA
ncbi:MAG TPA: type II toxin-antitoxin system MqsA family antitoxin [Phycisphaerales bacterium]|nr:type II toxin-antitoxin system MqsA family antitoxin [Phycisphaerales bacterium]